MNWYDQDMPDALPLLVLPGMVLMPHTRLPLNIDEPHYMRMVDAVLATWHRLVGMIQPVDEAGYGLANIGSAGRIVSFSEQDDGRYVISLGQISRFRLISTDQSFHPYSIGSVDWSGFEQDGKDRENDLQWDRAGFVDLMCRYLEAKGLSTDWDVVREAGAELLINSLSMALPLKAQDKQALLEAVTLFERSELLKGLLEYELRNGRYNEVLQ